MELKDALMITVLGIGVVYVGLILTSLMIYSFSLLPLVTAFFSAKKPAVDAEQVNADAVPRTTQPQPEVSPEILAVITSVLEVELRLRSSLTEGKFTFK